MSQVILLNKPFHVLSQFTDREQPDNPRATLAEFLDEVLHDESHGVTVDEIEVPPTSPAVGKSLGDLVGPGGQPLVIALRDADHGYVANPSPSTPVPAGTVLVVLGSDADVAALARRV